ncbi:hypothetical protein VXQ18_15060 [Brucella abortus]|nr:hypothetical protein [Brucella abortus]
MDAVAIDTETLGLNPHRDRLCVVQISLSDGTADVIQIEAGQKKAPNLVKLLKDRSITKIFHFGRFRPCGSGTCIRHHAAAGVLHQDRIKLTRTYTDRHGLKEICSELLDVSISKQQQSSDWAAEVLSQAQQNMRHRMSSTCIA